MKNLLENDESFSRVDIKLRSDLSNFGDRYGIPDSRMQISIFSSTSVPFQESYPLISWPTCTRTYGRTSPLHALGVAISVHNIQSSLQLEGSNRDWYSKKPLIDLGIAN